MKQNCPECGCPQSFPVRRRQVGGDLELFVSCTMCPYEMVLRRGHPQVVELELDIEKIRGRVLAGHRHLTSLLVKRERRLQALRRDLGLEE